MSGPKYSRAVIETARMLILIQQIDSQIEESKCQELNKQIEKELSKFKRLQSRLNSLDLESLFNECSSVIPGNPIFTDMKTVFEDINNFESKSIIKKSSKELSSYLTYYEITNKKLREKIDYLNENISELRFQLNKEKARFQISEATNNTLVVANNETDLKEFSFENKEYGTGQRSINTLNSRLFTLYSDLINLAEQSDNPIKQKQILKSIIENERTDEAYKLKQLELRRKMLSMNSPNDNKDLDAELLALRSILNISDTLLPSSDSQKKEECNLLRNELKNKVSDDYINKCVNEVIEECGYAVIRTDTVKTSSRSIERSFHDFSKDSVIQAAVSDDGAIMLEVMGKKEELSELDKSAIVKDMQHFCPDYKEVKERLRKRGIVLLDEQLYPAKEQYVRSAPKGCYKTDKTRRGVKHKEQLYADD